VGLTHGQYAASGDEIRHARCSRLSHGVAADRAASQRNLYAIHVNETVSAMASVATHLRQVKINPDMCATALHGLGE